jgi:pilus assembly protein CpaD
MSEIDAERRTTVIGDYRQGRSTASDRSRTESNYNW